MDISGSGGGNGGITSVNPISLVGVNATADSTNRLTVSSPATLLNHEGSGLQLKINKNTDLNTGSLLYQTNYSGRAEIGLTGDDDFHFKVSPDGSNWHEAITIDKDTGIVNFPNGTPNTMPAEFGSGAAINIDYMTSKGADLVTNGTGLLGNNYNMPTDYVWDALISPGLPGSFKFEGYYSGFKQTGEFMAV